MCEKANDLLANLSLDQLIAVAAKVGISEGQLLGGLKGTCGGCPFNAGLTEEADMAQNYGCLPSAGEILELKRSSGANWACHSNESRMCAGLCHAAKDEQLDLTQGGLVRYSTWYHQGADAALAQATTRQAVAGGL